MRASRLLSLLMLLQLRESVTAEALAAELEVSERTIYRDMDALSEAGVPVYADRGPGGGFRLLNGYKTRLTGLDSPEAEAIFFGGVPGLALALGIGDAAARAWNKLMLALPAPAREDARRMSGRFHLDDADWYHMAAPTPFLPHVTRAVMDGVRASMRYESWSGVRDWSIDPLGLVLKAGNWYFVGQSDARTLVFKVASIRQFLSTSERFERPDRFDLPQNWADHLSAFEARLRPLTALLRLSSVGRDRLAKLGRFAADAVAAAGPADERGWSDVHLAIESVDQAALLLLGLGPELRVVAPTELRTRTRELALALAAGLQEPLD